MHLHPDDPVRHDDICADCHSTHLRKGYDADSDRYNTTFTLIRAATRPPSRRIGRPSRNNPSSFQPIATMLSDDSDMDRVHCLEPLASRRDQGIFVFCAMVDDHRLYIGAGRQ